jgi:hypothetical protein
MCMWHRFMPTTRMHLSEYSLRYLTRKRILSSTTLGVNASKASASSYTATVTATYLSVDLCASARAATTRDPKVLWVCPLSYRETQLVHHYLTDNLLFVVFIVYGSSIFLYFHLFSVKPNDSTSSHTEYAQSLSLHL